MGLHPCMLQGCWIVYPAWTGGMRMQHHLLTAESHDCQYAHVQYALHRMWLKPLGSGNTHLSLAAASMRLSTISVSTSAAAPASPLVAPLSSATKTGTNLHTNQIYGVTWFSPSKPPPVITDKDAGCHSNLACVWLVMRINLACCFQIAVHESLPSGPSVVNCSNICIPCTPVIGN